MAKTRKASKTGDQSVVIQDLSITIQATNRDRKDLQRWRNALVSAESITQPTRKLLYDLYEDMVLDEHLASVLDQRRLALTTTPLVFERDGKPVDAIQALIDSEGFDDLLTLILDSRVYGYSLIYADFSAPEPAIELVPRPHVIPTRHLVVANPYLTDGIDYTLPPYSNLYVGVGKPKDLGLLLKATPLVIVKRGNFGDWATFNELFGQPLRKGTYQTGDPAVKQQLDVALKNMGSTAWISVPEGADVEFVTSGQTAAAANTYQKLWEICDKGLSKLIVGQTMTTENGSSKSQGEVHERVANKISESDRQFALKVLNSRIKPLMLAQGLPADGDFRFVDPEEQLSKKDKADVDLKIHQLVAPLKKEWWKENYHVEFVDDQDADPNAEPVLPPDPTDEKPGNAPADKPGNSEKPDKGKAAELAFPDWMDRLRSFFWQAPTR